MDEKDAFFISGKEKDMIDIKIDNEGKV